MVLRLGLWDGLTHRYDEAQVNDIILTVIGILWLGNIDFAKDGSIADTEGTQIAVKETAELFGLTREALLQGLTERTYVAGGNTGVQSRMNQEQCLCVHVRVCVASRAACVSGGRCAVRACVRWCVASSASSSPRPRWCCCAGCCCCCCCCWWCCNCG